MNTCFTKVSMLALVAGIFISSSAMAQSYLDGSSKMRGDYGQMSRSQSGMSYRATVPNVQRSFSYEPSQNAIGSQKSNSNKSNDSAKAEG